MRSKRRARSRKKFDLEARARILGNCITAHLMQIKDLKQMRVRRRNLQRRLKKKKRSLLRKTSQSLIRKKKIKVRKKKSRTIQKMSGIFEAIIIKLFSKYGSSLQRIPASRSSKI